MLARLFTPGEVLYCMAKSAPARHLAVRLAAKEAAFKALAGSVEAKAIPWKDLEVVSSELGIPALRMHGRARDRAALMGVVSAHVTLTHSVTTAAAFVVLEGSNAP
jgi:holo-[acyl-carrier protein] synthase